ncbi:MAG: polyhydroxyalkanoic acid system family protein [Novosphingobium sp.]
MRIAVPHTIGKAEARRRVRERSGEIADFIPGFAKVTTTWSNEDAMALTVGAMGQQISGRIEIGEADVAFTIDLPPALAFVEPMVRGQIEAKGRKLLS